MLPGDVELGGSSHAMETHLDFKFHASGVALGKAFTFWGLSFLICKMGFLILTLPDCPTLPNDKRLKWNNVPWEVCDVTSKVTGDRGQQREALRLGLIEGLEEHKTD